MEIVKRSFIMFVVLFLIVKIMGKKQIKNLTMYDYVIGIAIGSIAADSIISVDEPLYIGLLALGVFGLIGFIFSLLSLKNNEVAEILDGEPLILFNNNHFSYVNLEKAKLNVAKVLEGCRLKGCFDINELDCAILEPSGEISILLKGEYQPLTSNDVKKDWQKKSKKQTLNYPIIIDGSLNEGNLKKANKNKDWLNNYLKDLNKGIKDISLLCIDNNDEVTIFYNEIDK